MHDEAGGASLFRRQAGSWCKKARGEYAVDAAFSILYQYRFSLFSSLFLSLCFLCKGLPLKDENGHEHEHKHEHEPLVQARQHRTAIANGMSSGGMGGVGIRHHGGARMSPLEIGMYVLLAAFCFAIVVFVVSCVVYASKFKPQPPDSPLAGSALPVLSGAARARAAANQLASGRRPPRESTTNAHDWVWLGRATLERAACGPQQVLFISNRRGYVSLSRGEFASGTEEFHCAHCTVPGKSDQQSSGWRKRGRRRRAGHLLRQSEPYRAAFGRAAQQWIERPADRYDHLLQEGQDAAKQFRYETSVETVHGRVRYHDPHSTIHAYVHRYFRAERVIISRYFFFFCVLFFTYSLIHSFVLL